jgi:hypothetical protein
VPRPPKRSKRAPRSPKRPVLTAGCARLHRPRSPKGSPDRQSRPLPSCRRSDPFSAVHPFPRDRGPVEAGCAARSSRNPKVPRRPCDSARPTETEASMKPDVLSVRRDQMAAPNRAPRSTAETKASSNRPVVVPSETKSLVRSDMRPPSREAEAPSRETCCPLRRRPTGPKSDGSPPKWTSARSSK